MPTRRQLFTVAAVTAVLTFIGGELANANVGPGGRGSAPPVSQKVCGLSERMVQQAPSGTWVISRANAFDTSGQQLCILADSKPGFRILNNLRFTGNWQAYPFTGVGCAYFLCSRNTDLPRKVWRLPSDVNSSFTWWGPSPGSWNASYDIWFDKRDQISTEDDGAELMIWLKPNPGYSGGHLVNVGGRWYWFMHWRVCDKVHICWNYIQFRFPAPVHSVVKLRLMPFIIWCVRHGHLIRWRWWLTSIHAGYEIVSGGGGLATTKFDAHT